MKVVQIGVKHGNVNTVDIDGSLKSLQEIVGGYIEPCAPFQLKVMGIEMLCNEEGLLKGLDPNENLYPFFFVGPCIMLGFNGENFTSLTNIQINFIHDWLKFDQK